MAPSTPLGLENGPTEDLLDHLVDGAFALTDPRGSIVKWTEGASKLLGWSPAEVIGRSGFAAPLICDQPDLAGEWVGYLAREREEIPPSEVEVQALNRDGMAQQVRISFLPVGLELGLEVNFFLKALALDLPRATLVDYLRREHSIVVDSLTASHAQGPESAAGKTIAGVLLLMHPAGDPVEAPQELRELADRLRIEQKEPTPSSAGMTAPPLPPEQQPAPPVEAAVQATPTQAPPPPPLPAEDAPASLVEARERAHRARVGEHEARVRVDELERLLEAAEAQGNDARLDADRSTAELVAISAERDQLQQRLEQARKEREDARARYEAAEAEAEELRVRVEESESIVRDAQAEAEQAREELAQRDGSADELRARLEQVEAERDERAEQARLEQERVRELEMQVASAEERSTGLDEELSDAKKRLTSLEDSLQDVTRRASALEEELGRNADETSDLREALNASSERAGQLEKELAERDERARLLDAERLLQAERAHALEDALEQVRAAAADATKWLDGGLPVALDVVLGELSAAREDAAELRDRLSAGVQAIPAARPATERGEAQTEPAPQADADSTSGPDPEDPAFVGPRIVELGSVSEDSDEPADSDEHSDDEPEAERSLPRFDLGSPEPVAASADGDEPSREGFDDADTGRARIRLDGRFFQLNAAFCELLGYREDELTRAMWPPVTAGDVAGLRETTRQVLEGELADARVETEYLDAHGLPAKITGILSLVRDDAGEPSYLELQLTAAE